MLFFEICSRFQSLHPPKDLSYPHGAWQLFPLGIFLVTFLSVPQLPVPVHVLGTPAFSAQSPGFPSSKLTL